jgi:hypothetical protein
VTVEPSGPFALFYKNNSGPVFRVLQGGTLDRAAAEDATAEAFARALVSDGNESRAACHLIARGSVTMVDACRPILVTGREW